MNMPERSPDFGSEMLIGVLLVAALAMCGGWSLRACVEPAHGRLAAGAPPCADAVVPVALEEPTACPDARHALGVPRSVGDRRVVIECRCPAPKARDPTARRP